MVCKGSAIMDQIIQLINNIRKSNLVQCIAKAIVIIKTLIIIYKAHIKMNELKVHLKNSARVGKDIFSLF